MTRVRTAQQELGCMDAFDYGMSAGLCVLLNMRRRAMHLTIAGLAVVTNRSGQLEATVAQISAIIEAEKCTVRRLFGVR